MAKDALGHGSDGNGAHSGQINKLPSKMTKAHFEVIAQQLREAKATPEQVADMASRLATTNPGFNRDRFIAAVTSGTVTMGSRQSSKDNAARQLSRGGAPVPGYGNSRDNPKIDIYHKGTYKASTTWARSPGEAKQKYLEANPTHSAGDVKTRYSK